MNRDHILQGCREDYLKKDFESLKRKYLMGKHFLTPEDCAKIEGVIEHYRAEKIAEAVRELGGTIIKE